MSGSPTFFHISLQNPKNIYTEMFYLYFQSSSASRQPKIANLMFFANPVYKVWSHPSAWHLKTFQWHGWTQSSNNSIFSLWNIPIFRWKIFYLHLQSSNASRKLKNANVIRFADLVYILGAFCTQSAVCILYWLDWYYWFCLSEPQVWTEIMELERKF